MYNINSIHELSRTVTSEMDKLSQLKIVYLYFLFFFPPQTQINVLTSKLPNAYSEVQYRILERWDLAFHFISPKLKRVEGWKLGSESIFYVV